MSAYRFPIYLLGLPGEPLDRIHAINSWCVMQAGIDFSTDREAAEKIFSQLKMSWASASWVQRHFYLGKSLLGQNGGSPVGYNADHTRCEEFIRDRTKTWGSPSFTSVGSNLFWDAIRTARGDQDNMPWRLFSALSAVNCAVGSKPHPFPVTRDFLRAAAVGFKSPDGLFRPDGGPTKRAMDELRDGLHFHTVRQMRDDLDQLEIQGLIGRIPLSKRVMAFFLPHHCSDEQALDWLKKKTTKRERPNELRQKAFEILEKARIGQS